MLFYVDMLRFAKDVADKVKNLSWPTSETQWNKLTEEQQNSFRFDLEKTLCALGWHDYEFVTRTKYGYDLECFYCGAVKGTNGGTHGDKVERATALLKECIERIEAGDYWDDEDVGGSYRSYFSQALLNQLKEEVDKR